MRYGVDRLASKVEEELRIRVLDGGLFVFVSRTRKRIKVLYWDNDGYALWTKRLEVGVFRIERIDGYEKITGVDFEKLLLGVELRRIKFCKMVGGKVV